LTLLKDQELEIATETESFHLPNHWENSAIPLHPTRITLNMLPEETKVEKLRQIFNSLAQLENVRVGGCELMISMNEDLSEEITSMENQLFVYTPASFGFQLATGAGNLVTQAIKGEVTIEEVVVGCGTEYGKLLED
jgi:hypothetical protein